MSKKAEMAFVDKISKMSDEIIEKKLWQLKIIGLSLIILSVIINLIYLSLSVIIGFSVSTRAVVNGVIILFLGIGFMVERNKIIAVKVALSFNEMKSSYPSVEIKN